MNDKIVSDRPKIPIIYRWSSPEYNNNRIILYFIVYDYHALLLYETKNKKLASDLSLTKYLKKINRINLI